MMTIKKYSKQVLVVILFVVLLFTFSSCEKAGYDKVNETNYKYLEIEDIVKGTGKVAKVGDTVHVQYSGYLANNGKKFDSSLDKGTPATKTKKAIKATPFAFKLGGGEVIKGWEDGILGMKVGGTRILRIPARLGYGYKGQLGSIPKNADLIFEVQLVDIYPIYKITFDSNGGEEMMEDITDIKKNSKVTLKANKFKRTGYKFKNWNTKKNGKGTSYPNKYVFSSFINKDLTLYAIWTKVKTYKISYQGNGGTGTMSSSDVAENSKITLTKNSFVRPNYKFVKWNTKKDGTGTSYKDGYIFKSYKLNANLTLYAIWTKA